MVNIVIVSHSARLAQGVEELARQMLHDSDVQIAVAGGIDDPENPIGTDAMKVYGAIESVYNEDGVLVLMDLGSALLSAEMALEFLSPQQQANVRLCPAPLVEGAVAAAVQASVGANLRQVYDEAMGALSAKQDQTPQDEPTEAAPAPGEQGATYNEISLTIGNRLGLHARPAAQFVATANRFSSKILVRRGQREANAKSINQVATLGARLGDEIVVRASGPDANEALHQLRLLVNANFGEEDEDEGQEEAVTVEAVATVDGGLIGIPASPGIAIGPAAHYRPQLPHVETLAVEDPAAEWQRLERALRDAGAEIQELQERVQRQGNQAEAAIFQAHELILRDPTFLETVRERIYARKINAAAAWQEETEAVAEQYRQLEDEYMRGRAADVLDVGARVLRHLLGLAPATLQLDQPSIILAGELTPSDTAQFEPSLVLGICTERGGATSHSAILARAFGIPAIVGLGPSIEKIADGETIAIDGHTGEIWLDPQAEQLDALRAQRQSWLKQEEAAKAASREPAVTQDGHHFEIAANIGGPHDVAVALEYGAEGVGLFRTEFLFLERDAPPSEEEQYQVYRSVTETMGERPVIIRTLDIGGDKPLPYLSTEAEPNPFLGWRGIRFCLDRPDLFIPQLRAILRAAHGRNVWLMLPMVSTLQEVRAVRELLLEIKKDLKAEGLPFNDELRVGIMIEVPAAVAIADQLAVEVDFFSIGTNDLTQYVMAADRGNRQVVELAQSLQPAVLRMVKQAVEAAHKAGIWIGMCGELAGNPLATPLLVGMELDELSMNAPSIPRVKAIVRSLDLERAKEIAQKVLEQESVAQVEEVLRTD